MLGGEELRSCIATVREFTDHRNVLVHVEQHTALGDFIDYAMHFDDKEELAMRVATATIIVFGEVALHQQDIPDPGFQQGVMDDLDAAERFLS